MESSFDDLWIDYSNCAIIMWFLPVSLFFFFSIYILTSFSKDKYTRKNIFYTFNRSFKFTILSITISYYSHVTWHCIFNIQSPATCISCSVWQAIELQNMFTRSYSQQKTSGEKKKDTLSILKSFWLAKILQNPHWFLIEPYLHSCPFHLHLKEPENNQSSQLINPSLFLGILHQCSENFTPWNFNWQFTCML